MRYFILVLCLVFSLNTHSTENLDSYRSARVQLFGVLHNDNNVITDVYCEEEYGIKDGVCPTCIPDPNLLNCEHTWPQSKFGNTNANQKKVDLHHLFPVTSHANSSRGNLPFGEVEGEIICRDSKRGTIKGTDVIGFEPPNNHKGNVARAMFYFSQRYNMPIDSIQEKYFRKWNKLDPIDSAERIRNNKIKELQGWTNPFIDNPNLADTISDF